MTRMPTLHSRKGIIRREFGGFYLHVGFHMKWSHGKATVLKSQVLFGNLAYLFNLAYVFRSIAEV